MFLKFSDIETASGIEFQLILTDRTSSAGQPIRKTKQFYFDDFIMLS